MAASRFRKVVDETHEIARRRGNGKLRREIWVDRNGRVVRFNLAYVNPQIHRGDNGRVLGYDSQHGRWHRHFMGEVSFSELQSFAEVETAFEKEVSRYLKGRVK